MTLFLEENLLKPNNCSESAISPLRLQRPMGHQTFIAFKPSDWGHHAKPTEIKGVAGSILA